MSPQTYKILVQTEQRLRNTVFHYQALKTAITFTEYKLNPNKLARVAGKLRKAKRELKVFRNAHSQLVK